MGELEHTHVRTATSHWSRVGESGSFWGMLFVYYCLRLLGRVITTPILYVVVTYFFVVNRSAREASREFLVRVREHTGETGKPVTLREQYAHFITFAEAIIDRIECWTGRVTRSDIEFSNRPEVLEMLGSGQGCMILTSHLGNVEMCRAFLSQIREARMNVLVNFSNARLINRLMEHIHEDVTLNLVDITSITPATAVQLKQLIDNGEAVVVAADRTPADSSGSTTEACFLGERARFPGGPFIMASLFECPVYTMFCLKENDHYSIHFEPFAHRIDIPRHTRREALARYAGRYAEKLSSMSVRYPKQWFNFYHYWETPNDERQ